MDSMIVKEESQQECQSELTVPKEIPKIFVGGLHPTTTKFTLLEHFQKFGKILDYVLMWDRARNRSRCFGFITFADVSVSDQVLTVPHFIDGKLVDVKKAQPKQDTFGDVANMDPAFITTKLFVGGIPAEATLSEYKQVFKKYGKLTDCVLINDRHTGKPRGFGFVEFQNHKAVERVMKDYYKIVVGGKWVECKKALPRQSPTFNPDQQAQFQDQQSFMDQQQQQSQFILANGINLCQQEDQDSQMMFQQQQQQQQPAVPEFQFYSANIQQWDIKNEAVVETVQPFIPQQQPQKIEQIMEMPRLQDEGLNVFGEFKDSPTNSPLIKREFSNKENVHPNITYPILELSSGKKNRSLLSSLIKQVQIVKEEEGAQNFEDEENMVKDPRKQEILKRTTRRKLKLDLEEINVQPNFRIMQFAQEANQPYNGES